MLLQPLRNRAWRVFDRLGYDIRRKREAGWGVDAFADQVRHLRPEPVRIIVDAGANVGDSVAVYRAHFPGTTIVAFEPFPAVYEQLAARYASAPEVRPQRMGLSDSSGPRPFYANDVAVTNSLLPIDDAGREWEMTGVPATRPSLEVPTTTLDQFCADERMATLDILKLDIQGGEGMALRGASALLHRKAIRLIYTEVLFAQLYAGQASFYDLVAQLAAHDYQLFGLYNLVQGEQGLGWGDAIFLPR